MDVIVARDINRHSGASPQAGETPLSTLVDGFLSHDDLDARLGADEHLFPRFMARLSGTLERAFAGSCPQSRFEAHKSLYLLYEDHIRTPRPGAGANQYHPFIMRIRSEIEKAWESFEAGRVRLDPAEIPDDDLGFERFLKDRVLTNQLADHPLFIFLEERASHEEFRSFLLHEGTLVLRFCDLMVLSMLGVDEEVRSELADNFWDEVGNGDYRNRHTEAFRRLLRHAGLEADDGHFLSADMIDRLQWQGLAGYNLYLNGLLHRRNYFKSVGSLGASEIMDPRQYARVLRGCRRVGFDDEQGLAYYADHSELDVAHGEGWLRNVMLPLLRRHPESRVDMVAGALMRINTAADYYDYLHRKLTSRAAVLASLDLSSGSVRTSSGAV